ncbi:MAG: Ger(x)C family spore germination protein [Bacillota bacterium]|nr:Ger(x)C family spore germination protein [Bacillota bacterium]
MVRPLPVRFVALVVLLSLLLQGCWSIHDPRDLTLASAFGVDTAGAGNLLLAVELVNPRIAGGPLGGGGQPEKPTRVLYSVAESVFRAQRAIDQTIGKVVFAGEASVALVGRKLALAGAAPMLDFVVRQHQLRRTISLVLAEGDVAQILATPTIRDTASAEIVGLLHNGNFTGYTSDVTANMFLADMALPGKEPVMPVVSLTDLPQAQSAARPPSAPGAGPGGGNQSGDSAQGGQPAQPKPQVMLMNTIACFRHDKLIGVLTPSETRGLLFLRNEISTTLISVPVSEGEGLTVVEVVRSHSSTKPTVSRARTASFEIKIHVTAEVADVPVFTEDVGKLARVRELEQEVARSIEGEVSACITRLQRELHTDCLGFGLAIYRQNPSHWRQIADQWHDLFQSVPYSVSAQVQIRSTGTVGTGIGVRREVPK